MRLLTEEEIAGVCGRFARPENKKEGLHLLAEMAADAEHKETLKAVGELLEDKHLIVDPVTHEPQGYWIDLVDGNKLKRGEMPEEV